MHTILFYLFTCLGTVIVIVVKGGLHNVETKYSDVGNRRTMGCTGRYKNTICYSN